MPNGSPGDARLPLRPGRRRRRDLRVRGTAAYRARLEEGWEHACTYAALHNFVWHELDKAEGELDSRAADFVQSCYDVRDPRGLATYGLLAVQKRCRAKGCPEEA